MLIFAFATLVLAGCKKYDGDSYNFSDSVPSYVQIKTKTAISTHVGNTISFTVQMRTAVQADVIYTYSFAGVQYKDTIKRNTLSRVTAIVVPDILGGASSVETGIKLDAAYNVKTNSDFTIGLYGADKENIPVTVYP